MTVRISDHAINMAKERLGLKGNSSIIQFLERGFDKGSRVTLHNNCKSKRFLDSRTGINTRPVIFNDLCLIVDDSHKTVITVYKLPWWFWKNAYGFLTDDQIRKIERKAMKIPVGPTKTSGICGDEIIQGHLSLLRQLIRR